MFCFCIFIFFCVLFLSLCWLCNWHLTLLSLHVNMYPFFLPWRNSHSGPRPPHIEDSWSHSDTPHSVGLLWTSDQFEAETFIWQHTTLKQTSMSAEPTIPASERLQIHTLHRAATEFVNMYPLNILLLLLGRLSLWYIVQWYCGVNSKLRTWYFESN